MNWAEALSLLAVMVVVGFFWDSIVVYPLKILVVFFHELSHGLVAMITGGEIVRIEVVKEQGGLCVTRGGSRFLTLSAGYLGSLMWGGVIVMLAARTRHDRKVSILIGAILIGATLLWVRPLASFGFGFGLAAGLVLGGVGYMCGHAVNDYLLKVIGLTSCIYAILDIKSDVIDRSGLQSDAAMLAKEAGLLSTQMWGILWIAIAVVSSLFFLVGACRRTPDRESAKA